MKRNICTILLCILIIRVTHSQIYLWSDKKKFSYRTWSKQIGIDKEFNAYLFTTFQDWEHASNPQKSGFAITKYDAIGNLIWENVFENSYDPVSKTYYYASATDFKVDPAGNIYLLTNGNLSIINQSVVPLHGCSTLLKFDKDFNLIWYRELIYSTNALAFDKIGNVFITGFLSEEKTAFGNFTLGNADGGIFIAKYDAEGTCIWAIADGSSFSQGKIITVDEGGNLNIAVTFNDSECTIGNSIFNKSDGMTVIAQYNSKGVFQWAKQLKSPTQIFPAITSICSDHAGNIYYSGIFAGTVAFDSYTLTNSVFENNLFVAKYNSSGSAKWALSFGGQGNEYCWTSCMNGNDELLISGGFVDTISFGNNTLFDAGMGSYFVAKLDSLGFSKWAIKQSGMSFGGTGIYCITAGATNDLYLAGCFTNYVNLGATTFTNSGLPLGFCTKLIDTSFVLGVKSIYGKKCEFKIYPNPTGDIFTVTCIGNLTNQKLQVKITDISGKIIYSETINDFKGNLAKEINLSSVPKGTYFIQLNSGDFTEAKKIVIE